MFRSVFLRRGEGCFSWRGWAVAIYFSLCRGLLRGLLRGLFLSSSPPSLAKRSLIDRISKLLRYGMKCQLTLVPVVDEHPRFVLKSLIFISQSRDIIWKRDPL